MNDNTLPHFNDYKRTHTVFPETVVDGIRSANILFLSVFDAYETIGILVSLQERLGLSDEDLECSGLDNFTGEIKKGKVNIVCCGDAELESIPDSVMGQLSSSTEDTGCWDEKWAALRVTVRNSFYNRYELVTSESLGRFPPSAQSFEDVAYVHDDTEFLYHPFDIDEKDLGKNTLAEGVY